ncbi:S-layer homology domain-containing protein [Paenibacillus agaridevorans]|uniref:S-layer homology domain-containing protein n=1 Tax=Paenibacillus agaridevorans TaxID=171404 RepID=UPI001BE4CD5C|nr:S-layer homology domain-containing protein [Paenibacillus agaridevorans]
MKHSRFAMIAVLLISFIAVSILQPSKQLQAAASDTTFEITSQTVEAKPGDTIELSVSAQDAKLVYGYELTIHYPAEHLRFNKSASSFSSASFHKLFDKEPGKLLVFGTKTGRQQGDSGNLDLAGIQFDVISKKNVDTTIIVELSKVKLITRDQDASSFDVSKKVDFKIKPQIQIQLKDIAGHWAEEYIIRALELGFVNGYPDRTFRPNRPVTRAEFAVMTARAMELSPKGNPAMFKDQNLIHDWAHTGVSALVEREIINGYPDETFRPTRDITRSELAVIMARTLKLDTSDVHHHAFNDSKEMAEWAEPSIAAAVSAGLLQGRGNNRFKPNELTTRAEAVKAILSVLDSAGLS